MAARTARTGRALAPLLRTHDRDGAVLVEAQQLREAQVEAGGDARGDVQRRARLPRSTCESIGALTPQRSARSRNDRPIASRRARTRPPIAATEVASISLITGVRYHVQSYRAGLARSLPSSRCSDPTCSSSAPAVRSAPPGWAPCWRESPRKRGSTSPPASRSSAPRPERSSRPTCWPASSRGRRVRPQRARRPSGTRRRR